MALAFSMSAREAIFVGFDFFRRFLEAEVVANDVVVEKGVEDDVGSNAVAATVLLEGGRRGCCCCCCCDDLSDGGVMEEG